MTKIEILNRNNFEQAIKIFTEAMQFDDESTQNIIDSTGLFYKKDNFISIGLKKNEQYVGFGSLIPYEKTSWIPYIGVKPGFQGQGLGKIVVSKILEIAKDNKWETLELCASHAGAPLYSKLGFVENYPTTLYEIKGVKKSDKKKLDISKKIPAWLYNFDKKVLGTNRQKIFSIHHYAHITVISEQEKGYGILYGNRLGPVIADSFELAEQIYLTGVALGAKSIVSAETTPEKKDFIHRILDLIAIPNMDDYKMTYGKPLNEQSDFIFGLRSLAYG